MPSDLQTDSPTSGCHGGATEIAHSLAGGQATSAQEAQEALTALGLLATPHARSTTACPFDCYECDGMMLLIPGAGHATATEHTDNNVPSGLWSTANLAAERGLEVGSMLKYISWALGARLKPIVLRSNAASAVLSAIEAIETELRSRGRRLPVVIAAHSEGGASLMAVLRDHERWTCGSEVAVGIAGVALLDSVHSSKDMPPQGSCGAAWLQGGAVINWVVSTEALGHEKPKPWVKSGIMGGVRVRSAGTTAHLLVPWTACEAACAFLGGRLYAWAQDHEGEIPSK